MNQAKHDYTENYYLSSIKDETPFLPTFELKEIVIGDMLGQGGFGIVYDIKEMKLLPQEEEQDQPSSSLSSGIKNNNKKNCTSGE